MPFNDGFSTQGIPYTTGSDGQVLTWSDAQQQWVAADSSGGVGGSFLGVFLDTNSNLEGVGTSGDPLKVADNVDVNSVTASFKGDGSQLTNLPLSNYATKTDVTGAIDSALVPYALTSSVSGAITGALVPYITGAVTSGNITGSGLNNNPIVLKDSISLTAVTASFVSASDIITDYINFKNTSDPAWDNGRVWYNNTTHELNYWTEVNGFNIKLGQQLVQRCQNDENVLLTKGTVVHITGSTSSDTPRIKLADWTNDNLSANTLGLVAEDIAIGAAGYVIVQGILKGINTDTYNAGAMLFLSSSGQITGTKPSAPKHLVSVGQVVRKQSVNGSIYVSIQNGYEIGELHDVLTNGKTNGDMLVWDSSIPAWKNSTSLSGSYNFTNINSLTASNAYISGRVTINGTASIAHLDTLEQNNLKVGDKYITILSGGNTHVDLDGAGLLYGSGSTDETTGDEGSVAYALFRNAYNKVEIFPGLRVSGSLTASSGISGSFVGDGSGLINVPASAVNLSSYATLAGVSSSFASLNSANNFTANQTVTGSVFVNTSISSSQITGSFSGSGAGLYDIPASSISLTGYAKLDTANIFTANQTISGSLYVSSSLSTLDGLTGSAITSSNTLQVGGQSTFGGGVKLPIKTVTNNYSLVASTDYIVAFSGSNLTGTLPNASGIGGSTFIIKNLHTSSLLVNDGGSTIDGQSSITIYNQYSSYTFISDNTNWLIV